MLIALGVLVLAVFSLVFTIVYLVLLMERTTTRYTTLIERMAQRSEDERERIIQRKQFPDRPPVVHKPRKPPTADEIAKQRRRSAALRSVGTVNFEGDDGE